MTTFESVTGIYQLKSVSYTIESNTHPGRVYTVAVTDDGWTCDCKGFQYRRQCWHLRAVKDGNGGRPRYRVMPLPSRAKTMALVASLYGEG